MKYRFSDFVLNTELRELNHRNQPVTLTKRSYDLLHYLLINQEKIHSKDDLVEHVWAGRIVSDNTIDQSISKLRKTLNQYQEGDYIEVVYGQGVKFVPTVESLIDQPSKEPKRWQWLMAVAVILVLIIVGWPFKPQPNQPTIKPQVLLIPAAESKQQWAQIGTEQLLSQWIHYSGLATVVDFVDKPQFVDDQQFIVNQQTFMPRLQTIESQMEQIDGNFQLTVTVSQHNKNISQIFNGEHLGHVLQSATDWLQSALSLNTHSPTETYLLPPSDHVAELYLRAMESLNSHDYDKARKQLDLITEEAPTFYLAQYQLAHVLSLQNQHDESLATLNTLLQLPISTELNIASFSLKAYVLDTLGKYDEAIALYTELFTKYKDQVSLPLLKARYEYSYVLVNTNQATVADQQLDVVLEYLNESENVALLASTLALKGSIQQKLGHIESAQHHLQQALDLFERNHDSLGAAKTLSALARIASQQANYTLAEAYLNESLAITQSIGFKLGEGATLNELTYVLMVQGEHNKARKMAQQLEKIAIEIEYPAMQMAAKQLFFDMAREQKQWPEAQRQLKQHFDLASSTNNGRALIKNNMLALSLYVDTGELEKTKPLIDELQQHIDQQHEIRMQPRLDWFMARIKWQENKSDIALELLQKAKQQALQNEDGESLININNTLAEIYLSQNQADLAMKALQESTKYKPFALPYLKLMAQTHEQLGQQIKALKTMNLCQQKSADLWTSSDNEYLKHLTDMVQQSSAVDEPQHQ
ncbi:tetratricopeptide repeat protein [Marinicella litoralis]|uniref:DNA-binding winged helix-turn-helix (WHTH) protein n=1 Tax=Marinicella litoralis TaxID=644220 RepID=A0A4R6XP81_9GAMM|nr:tetratricopeptide repeat protein [Marinicella litoralis]TDR19557.1 DNA-binding winged helix-turn-helix (wHTH) protein [Marinicella litoralis]